jgi:MFS family permease
MEIDLTTPALLFSTISLLLLAFTNRFLGLAKTIRELYSEYQDNPQKRFIDQIKNLRQRVYLIRNMQMLGAGSLLLCTLSMLFVFAGRQPPAMLTFTVSLILMVSALALSIIEIGMSVGALNILLSDMEQSLASDDRPVQGWSWLWRRLGRFSLTTLFWLCVVLALLILWLRDHWELKRLTEGPKVGMSSWSIQPDNQSDTIDGRRRGFGGDDRIREDSSFSSVST